MPWPTLGPERARLGDDASAGNLVLGDPTEGDDSAALTGTAVQSLAGATLGARQVASAASASADFERTIGHGNAPVAGPGGRVIPR